MTEVWAPVPGWEGYYEVSTHGRVRGVERQVPTARGPRLLRQQLLSSFVDSHGYPVVHLCRDGKPQRLRVHTLVLTAFVGPRPEGQEACHGNDIKTDNRLWNLRWAPQSANAADKVKNNRHPRKFNREIVLEMRRLREEGMSYEKIASAFGCSRKGAEKAIKGETYAWLE